MKNLPAIVLIILSGVFLWGRGGVDAAEPPAGPTAHAETDTIPPTLVEAFGRYDSLSVVVVFSEPVGAGADQPASYAVIPLGKPGDPIPVVGASVFGDSVALELDDPLAENTIHVVYVAGVEDLAGNEILPGSSVYFTTNGRLFGFISDDLVLTKAFPGPVYHVIGDLFIQPGATLTVEPGVTVLFQAGADLLNGGDYFSRSEIICEGTLVAVGAPGDSICFTSTAAAPGPGDWGQLCAGEGSVATLSHVIVEWAGTGVKARSSSRVTVEDSRLSHLGTADGAGVVGESADLVVRRCRFSDLNGYGVYTEGGTVLCVDNSFWEVRRSGIMLWGGEGSVEGNHLSHIGGYSQGRDLGVGIFLLEGAAADVRDNTIEYVGDSGFCVDEPAPSPRVFERNTVRHALGKGMYLGEPGPDTLRCWDVLDVAQNGIAIGYPPTGESVVFENCLIARCGWSAVQVASSMYIYAGNVSFDYTTISDCAYNGIEILNYNTAVTATVRNSIIANTGWSGIAAADGMPDPLVEFVDLWNTAGGAFSNATCDTACTGIDPQFVDPANDDFHLASSSPLRLFGENGTQIGRYGPGNEVSTAVPERPVPGVSLLRNAPNPFRGSTVISFELEGEAEVRLRVFDIAGRPVRTLVERTLNPGRQTVAWDGRDGAGVRVAPGIYLYRLEAGPVRKSGKAVVIG